MVPLCSRIDRVSQSKKSEHRRTWPLRWRHFGVHTAQMGAEHRSNLRLSPDTYKAIDLLRKRMPGNVSRNTWIAIAVQEKIDRDMLAAKSDED